MARKRKKRVKQPGLPPGSLVYVGEAGAKPPLITVWDYDEAGLNEYQFTNVDDCVPFRNNQRVTWINVDGLTDVSIVEKLGVRYNLHPLVMEDILHTTQRPKIEEHDDFIYVVLRMIDFDSEKMQVGSEQVSFILTSENVLTFQESPGDVFGPVRDRLKGNKGRIRKLGPDYLLYALMDSLVDHYFFVLEKLGDKIEELEEHMLEQSAANLAHRLHELKRETIILRKSVWPLREAIGGLERLDTPLIKDSTKLFVRDMYDHTIQVIDTVESYRDLLAGMLEIYLASQSNRLNEVMKVLTIISTIFIPLTFIVGVYGMNFRNMPELEWSFGYPAVWIIMLMIAGGMVYFFRKKRWI
ncbi:MAG: magnesium/cobalt transporter CorA [Deltaproteobacteria bacterium]|nr:magnesium/cobalt transporter CorA [Deltaproteobacteria bacterium]